MCASSIIAAAGTRIAILANVDDVHSRTASVGTYPTSSRDARRPRTATLDDKALFVGIYRKQPPALC
jgi:hypothetical protein